MTDVYIYMLNRAVPRVTQCGAIALAQSFAQGEHTMMPSWMNVGTRAAEESVLYSLGLRAGVIRPALICEGYVSHWVRFAHYGWLCRRFVLFVIYH